MLKSEITVLIRDLKKKCIVIQQFDGGLMGDYKVKEYDYKKFSQLLIKELREVHKEFQDRINARLIAESYTAEE